MDGSPDELSLRELYHILRRGAAPILGVSLAIAALAFLVIHLRPRTFDASATVQVSPLPITKDATNGQVLDLAPLTHLSFDTYRNIATSDAVLQATLGDLGGAGGGMTAQQLRDDVSVSQSAGGQEPLTVTHQVSTSSAALSASLANAWSRETVATARKTLSASVGDVVSNLKDQVGSQSASLSNAEDAWAAFEQSDDRSTINAELSSIDQQTASLQARVLELDRDMARARAQQDLLHAIIAARQSGSPADVQTQLAALANKGVIDPKSANALASAVATLPPGVALASQDVATLVARSQLQDQLQTLQADQAERQAVQGQLKTLGPRASNLRAHLATLDKKAGELQRDLTTAQQAYASASTAYAQASASMKLVPTMASVLVPASKPLRPAGRHAVAVTVVAFVLAVLAMTMLTFLRAAVADDAGRRVADNVRTESRAASAEEAAVPAPRAVAALREHERPTPTASEATGARDPSGV